MNATAFVDIHCHLLPGIDDGAKSWDESLEMARMAVEDGITTIITTPHQLGGFARNLGNEIRKQTKALQALLDQERIPLQVLPGGDVRIEDSLLPGLRSGEVMSLADHRKHVLLELPHELYFDLKPVLTGLRQQGIQGILSHPERNQGLLARPGLVKELVDVGCLMQVTAGSLLGTFGPPSQAMAEAMLRDGHVHFLATDAHGPKARRPLIHRAFTRAWELVGRAAAEEMCSVNPAAVAAGRQVTPGARSARGEAAPKKSRSWFGIRRAS